jgi:carbonic anhydrase
VRANISFSVNQLLEGSSILGQFIRNSEVYIIGAEYSLESGLVTFINELFSI